MALRDSKGLRRLTGSQVKRAAEMLARAFHDNPGISYYFPDDKERRRVLPYIFQYSIRRGLLYGEVCTTSANLEGVAVWLSSENLFMNTQRIEKCGGLEMMSKVGKENLAHFMSFGEYLGSVHNRLAPFKHWYLLGIGVDPIHQGKGYGGNLLKAKLVDIDQERLPCYLETQNEKNLPVYQHYGFKVVDESTVPNTRVTNWAMLRDKGY